MIYICTGQHADVKHATISVVKEVMRSTFNRVIIAQNYRITWVNANAEMLNEHLQKTTK